MTTTPTDDIAVEPIYRQIGDRLRVYRLESGLSQQQLADLSGHAQTQISKYEQGVIRTPLASIQSILASLGRTLELRTPPADLALSPELAELLDRIAACLHLIDPAHVTLMRYMVEQAEMVGRTRENGDAG